MPSAPVIASLRMYLRVTRLAQRDQIAPIVSATFTQRLLMMDLLCFHDDPTLKAQLIERMLRSVLPPPQVTGGLPVRQAQSSVQGSTTVEAPTPSRVPMHTPSVNIR